MARLYAYHSPRRNSLSTRQNELDEVVSGALTKNNGTFSPIVSQVPTSTPVPAPILAFVSATANLVANYFEQKLFCLLKICIKIKGLSQKNRANIILKLVF